MFGPNDMTSEKKEDVYDLLRMAGHSAFKAAEITLDYERGDKVAAGWVNAARTAKATQP